MARDRSDIKVTASDALEFEPVETTARPPSRRGLKMTVAVVALIGVVAGGWVVYGDTLVAMLANSGDDVPLIRAEQGPVKVRPENPGGLQVPNRDKLVYNRIAGADPEPSQPVERLLPRAETPLPVPRATPPARVPAARMELPPKTAATQPPQPKTERVPALADVKTVKPPVPPQPPANALRSGAPLSLSKGSQPLSLKKSPDIAPAPPASPVGQVSAARPLSPTSRQTAKVPKPAPKPTPAPSSVTTQAQAANASKTYRVQLAASRSPEGARAEWDRVRRKNLDLLGDLGLTVTKVDLGPKKGVFYRLRVGPLAGDAQARKLCAELAKRRIGCLVVKPGA